MNAPRQDQQAPKPPGTGPETARERWPGPFQHLTDDQFSAQFLEAGRVHRHSRDVCGGMLPEAHLRRTYRRHGCATLEEFAGKAAGLRKEYVRKVLALFRKIADKPLLSCLLQTGRAGWSKICAVASVATPETDALWAGLVCTLSKADLEAHVRAYRQGHAGGATAETSRPATSKSAAQPATGASARGSAGVGSDEAPGAAAHHAGTTDAGTTDAGTTDAGATDAGTTDAGTGDAGRRDGRARTTAPGAAPNSPETGADTPSDGRSDDDQDDEGPLPPNHRISIVVDVLAAEELKRLTEDMRRRHKRPFTDSEVLLEAVRAFRGSQPGRRRYREVIYRAPDGQHVVMTRWGLVRMPDDWLAGAEQAAPPVDLEQERQACERAADAAVSAADEGAFPGDGPPIEAPGEAQAPPSPAALPPPRAPSGGTTGEPRGRRPHRHIPRAILDHVFHRSSGFCEFPRCRSRATILHHVRRFALDPRHGPDDLVHLCRPHEHLAHEGLIANELDPPALWRVRMDRKAATPEEAARARVDAKVRAHRARSD